MAKSSTGRNKRRDHPKGRANLSTTWTQDQGPQGSRRQAAGPLKSDWFSLEYKLRSMSFISEVGQPLSQENEMVGSGQIKQMQAKRRHCYISKNWKVKTFSNSEEIWIWRDWSARENGLVRGAIWQQEVRRVLWQSCGYSGSSPGLSFEWKG